MEELFKIEKERLDINLMNPLIWAYVGDAVFELHIRTYLINTTNLKPHQLHVASIQYVKAQAQASCLKRIEERLTEEERDIVRRGRNCKNHHLPKHVDVAQYAYSTAFEGLIGYLYLTKQNDRLKEILSWSIEENK